MVDLEAMRMPAASGVPLQREEEWESADQAAVVVEEEEEARAGVAHQAGEEVRPPRSPTEKECGGRSGEKVFERSLIETISMLFRRI